MKLDFEAHTQPIDSALPSSPGSLELRDFEAYNRLALPELVVTHLQAIINPEMASIEEHVKAQLMDIVRICQSMVAQNFQLVRASSSSARESVQPSSSQATHTSPRTGDTPAAMRPPQAPSTAHSPTKFFQEPPHMNVEASEPAVGPSQEANSQSLSQCHVSDSGYFSTANLCDCICHFGSDLDPTLNGMAALFH